jgi:2-dehydro-3-deoxyphosphogluconate aldolase / (4S)-4-hydroxy-2-oxoglutarate aldolase
MQESNRVLTLIKQQKILPLFYHDDTEVCLGVAKALYNAGIRAIEFTNRGEMALQNFKALVAARNETMPNLLLAVGTIRNAAQAIAFIDAGADFLISPMFDPAICEAAKQHHTLWIPGCMTPTEIRMAETSGCKVVKLFPGSVLTPDFVVAVRDLFPSIDFIVTGGVDATKENIESWFKAGVCAAGMGSKLISGQLMNTKNYEQLEKDTKKVLTLAQTNMG